jgi:hypothetical protein
MSVSFNIGGQIVPIQVPLTNGAVRSFGHMTLNIAGMEFTGGFKEFKRSRKRKRELPMSNSPDPIGKTLGENEYQASGVFYFDWWMNMIQAVQNTLGPGYGDQFFTIYCSYTGVGLVPYTDHILGCTIDSSDASDAAGVGALTRPIEFTPIKIKFGGYEDLADPLIAPPT